MNPELKKLAIWGLELASSPRPERDGLEDYFTAIRGRENLRLRLRDQEDGLEYYVTLLDIPYLGNKSAALAEIIG